MYEAKRNKLMKRSAAVATLLLLGGCRLVIETDQTGYIVSKSGLYDCLQASCAFDVTTEITENFTAEPTEGYRFVRWHGLCKAAPSRVCRASVAPLPEEYAMFEGDMLLSAEFEPDNTLRKWFRDRDGDKFGAANETTVSKRRPTGFVINSKDCNDSSEQVLSLIHI